MLPPIEFSIGSSPCDVVPDATAANTSSKRSHATVSEPGHARSAAVSLYAPAAPWNAIRIEPPKNEKGHYPLGEWPLLKKPVDVFGPYPQRASGLRGPVLPIKIIATVDMPRQCTGIAG